MLAALTWRVGPVAWPPLGAGWPLAPGAALGAGAGVALALAIASASQASKSAGDSAWTSNSMIRWPVPHSSAHWPRNVWPASAASTLKSNTFTRPGTTSRLNRNWGT